MSERLVIVGWDGSAVADEAVHWAARCSERFGRRLRVVMVVRSGPDPRTDAFARARALIAEVAPEVAVETEVINGHPVEALRDQSAEGALVAVGTRGHSQFASTLLGSVSDGLSQHARGPIVIVRGSTEHEPSAPVVVGVDGSDTSARAIDFAAEYAEGAGAPLLGVAAWPYPWRAQDPKDLETAVLDGQAHAERLLSAALAEVRAAHPDLVVDSLLTDTDPAQALIEAAREAQLVVVGSRGRGGFAGMLLGSVSRTVLRHAPCPVAVVRPRR
ncbi:MAG: universal stress protein [Propionibacteriaceae bacterium]|nr:universal stress protein [Propionibacteriaceae bacterium]